MDTENTVVDTQPEVDTAQETSEEDTTIESNEVDNTQESQSDTQETVETQSETELPFIIKYNKQDLSLTADEARELAQIGKLVKDKNALDFIKSSEERARQAGFDNLVDFDNAIRENLLAQEAAQLVEEKGIDEETARELLELRAEKENRLTAEQQKRQEELEQQKTIEEVKEFNGMFPDEDVSNLPDEVYEYKKQNPNISISDAFLRYQYQQSKIKQSVTEKQQENQESSTSSLNDVPNNSDDFNLKIHNAVFY